MAATSPASPASLWLDELSLTYSGIGLIETEYQALVIAPNPAQDNLCIEGEFAPDTMYEIINTHGQVVKQGIRSGCIDIKYIPAGCYQLILKSIGCNLIAGKFIKVE